MRTEILRGSDYGVGRDLKVNFIDVPAYWGDVRVSFTEGAKLEGRDFIIWGGYGGGSFTMASLVEALSPFARRVIHFPDIRSKHVIGPGLDQFPGRIYRAVITGLGKIVDLPPKDLIFWGYSHGAKMAVRTALSAKIGGIPVDGVVLINGALENLSSAKIVISLARESVQAVRKKSEMRRIFPRTDGSLSIPQMLKNIFRDPLLLKGEGKWWEHLKRIPKVMVVSEGDREVGVKNLKHLGDFQDSLRVVCLPGGHWAPVLNPNQYVSEAISALKSLGLTNLESA